MSAEYRIQKYCPEYELKVARLQMHMWSPDECLNRSYLEWKYERNPYVTSPHIYLALLGDEVVGMRGFFGSRWLIGAQNTPRTVLCAGDLVIHPEHRNRGLLTKIMNAAFEDLARSGHEIVFNLTASAVNFVASMSTGWKKTAPVGFVIRPAARTPRMPMERTRRRLKRFALIRQAVRMIPRSRMLRSRVSDQPFRLMDTTFKDRDQGNSPRLSLERKPRPAEMERLVRRIAQDARIRHVRDAEYFTWRFEDPLLEFRFLVYEEEGMQGYLVLGRSTSTMQDPHTVRILDWEGSSDSVREELLCAALVAGEHSSVITWTATLPDKAKCLLTQNGFIPLDNPNELSHQRPCILIRPVRDEGLNAEFCFDEASLLDLANWDIRMLYGL